LRIGHEERLDDTVNNPSCCQEHKELIFPPTGLFTNLIGKLKNNYIKPNIHNRPRHCGDALQDEICAKRHIAN
jgi:hypothetical protein